MADTENKVEQIASNITSGVLSAVIISIVVFLWMNSSNSFKNESRAALVAMLKSAGDSFSRLLNRSQPQSQSQLQSQQQLAHSLPTQVITSAEEVDKHSSPKHKHSAAAPAARNYSNDDTDSKIAVLPVPPFAVPTAPKIPKVIQHGKPVQFIKKTVAHVPLYETIIDLKDPETFISIGLANNAVMANDKDLSHGDESFDSFVRKAHASVVMNGTFFSKDDQKRVMGNMVSSGRFLKYSPWENIGTTFGLTRHNHPVMITARREELPKWGEHWFSLTCGPRLLKDGEVWIDALEEGFEDPHVLGIGPRCALGFNVARDKLILCTFMNGLSLTQEAKLMKELGCSEAMNLDGGASRSLAHDGAIVVPAGRPLTNVLMVYDAKNKAPQSLVKSWEQFQEAPRITSAY